MELKINSGFFMNLFDAVENKLCVDCLNKPKGMDVDYNLYKDEYSHNAMDLLKKYKKEININDKTEYIYLTRGCLTKFDIYQRLYEFYDNFKIVNRELKRILQGYHDQTISTCDIDCLRFDSKVEFEKFFKDIIPEAIFMNKYILKVRVFGSQYSF
jgi:hypothetical protein